MILSARRSLFGLLMALALVNPPAGAQPATQPDSVSGQLPRGVGRIPPPDKLTDGQFLVDTGPGLDTGCSYRGGGPLLITLRVNRAVGPVDAQGFLLDPQALISAGLISEMATIRFPAYDVDSEASVPNGAPEVDLVSFNGHRLSIGQTQLRGVNNEWKMQEFKVPIGQIKFPRAAVTGGTLVPAENQLRIDIDTANSDQLWCTAVDWVFLEVGVQAPLVLVHGINAQSDTWDAVIPYLNTTGLPYARVNLGANSSCEDNAATLKTALDGVQSQLGCKAVHVVCHSKGGLDTRTYLSNYYNADMLQVRSVFTLDTPHEGSVQADIAVDAASIANLTAHDPLLSTAIQYAGQYFISNFGPNGAGLASLTVDNRRFANSTLVLPQGVRVFTYGADADGNGDGQIRGAEWSGLPFVPFVNRDHLATNMYQVLRDVRSVAVRIEYPTGNTGSPVFTLIGTSTGSSQLNDLCVTVNSAQFAGQSHFHTLTNTNHFTIKNQAVMTQVIEKIGTEFPVH